MTVLRRPEREIPLPHRLNGASGTSAEALGFRVGIDDLPWPVVLLDPDTRIVAVNAAWGTVGPMPATPVVGQCYLGWCVDTLGDLATARIADRLAGLATAASPEAVTHVVEVLDDGSPVQALTLSRVPGTPAHVMVAHDVDRVERGLIEAAGAREALWRDLFLGNPAVMLLIDPETKRILDASIGAVRFYGYALSELQGMDIGTINMLSDAEIRQCIDEATEAPEGTRQFRFPHRLASGEVRQVEVLTAQVRLGGQPLLQSVVHDVTEQAQTEAHRNLLATAVEVTGDAVVITDVDARIVYVNPAFEQTSGYAAADVIGRNPRLLQSGEHPPAFYAELWRVLASGRTWVGELHNRRRDGTPYIEEASISPVYDERGGLMHYVGVKHDVTRERSERAAREQLAKVVDSAAEAMCAIGLDGTFLAWNDAATRIFGLERERVLGHRVFEFMSEGLAEAMHRWIARVALGETIGPLDAPMTTATGEPRILSITATPIRQGGLGVTAVASIARDVTEDRRLAKEREGLEAELRQAQKLEVIGRLAGGVAHDFNNLLTAIQGFASIVAGTVDAETRADVEQILAAAARGTELTRRLLSFSRAVPLEPRAIDLDASLQSAWHLVARLVPERIDLELSASSGAWVVIDPVEVDQLLMNLVINAVDAIPGSGRVRVASAMAAEPAHRGASEATHVMLTVEDTGTGMDEATRRRVFEPFFTTKPDGHGTGLGLANVFAIVERAGGVVEVQSTPGDGSRFTIRLAATGRPPNSPDGAASEAAANLPAANAGHDGIRILVVDDSAVVLGLTARILTSAGYVVTAVTSPDEALAADTVGIRAIVSDVVMPGMSGLELVDRLDLAVPVVLVSGYSEVGVDIDPRARPPRAFLPKPFDAEDLLATLHRLIDTA